MIHDLPDTTAAKVASAIVQARHQAGVPAVGMVATLVIIADEATHYDALRSAQEMSREHPARILVAIARPGNQAARLDAELRFLGDSGPGETVTLRLHGELAGHAESVLLPLLLPDAPVVVWWPCQAPAVPAQDPVGQLARRRVTDAAGGTDPFGELQARADGYQAGDTDLSWTRITGWRTILAAALDLPYSPILGGEVACQPKSPSAELLARWLELKLGVSIDRTDSEGPGITGVTLRTEGGDLSITRPDGRVASLTRPGQPVREVPLHARGTTEIIAEEMRRLDPDEVFAETLQWDGDSGVSTPEIVVHRDVATMAAAAAARLITRLVDAQAAQGYAHLCLTGGRTGTAVLAAVAASPARDAVDWQRLDVWWSDERFLPAGHPDRNETGARAVLLEHLPIVSSRVHPMPARGGTGDDDPEAAAEGYAAELARAAHPEDRVAVPSFDVSLLGIGEDGHVASLFPGLPALHETDRSVVAVHGSPKPPPTRLSMTLPALCAAREMWIIATGAAKATALRLMLDEHAGPLQVPAAGARGTRRTLVLVDAEAGSRLPRGLDRIASP